MKEHPIIFNTENVKAILDGRKTQTRRVVDFGRFFNSNEHFKNNYKFKKMFYDDRKDENVAIFGYKPVGDEYGFTEWFKCPYGQVGDRLWVRELFYSLSAYVTYCDKETREVNVPCDANVMKAGIHPSIHLPKWASRITLEITDIRVERVVEIDIRDIHAEGIRLPEDKVGYWGKLYVDAFHNLWDKINAKRGYGWEVNPWVWVIEFKLVEGGNAYRK